MRCREKDFRVCAADGVGMLSSAHFPLPWTQVEIRLAFKGAFCRVARRFIHTLDGYELHHRQALSRPRS